MAKKTRAERKKQTQRALNNPNQASKQASVGDTYEIEENEASAEEIEAQEAKAAEAAKAEAEAKESEAERKLKEREAKQREKLVAREKKASARAAAKKGKTTRRGPKFFWKFVDYLKNVRVEMKRVVWPTRAELGRMSVIVIIALVFFGVLIYLVDSAVTPLLYMLSGIGG
jgi:preprotein translocase subunit SecE